MSITISPDDTKYGFVPVYGSRLKFVFLLVLFNEV